MIDKVSLESRIFRIGRECYVIYLGNNKDDVRPFLRIGTKPDIPGEVHDWVANTIVPDNHLGNPLIETMDARRFSGRYLGDPEIVVAIGQFFKSFNLSGTEVTDYEHVEKGEGRDIVFFYSDGNIQLQYERDVIFDLKQRQKEDGHYVRLYELAKAEFQRNSLQYLRQDMAGKGIIFCGKNPIWYENGELIAFGLGGGFVTELMMLGVDPDFISAVAYNMTSDEFNSSQASAYMGLVKRKRQLKSSIDVFTEEPALQKKISFLFPERDDIPKSIQVKSLSGKRSGKFGDSQIGFRNGNWKLTHEGLPALIFGQGGLNDISVDASRRRISMPKGNDSFTVPSGIPVNFIDSAPVDSQIVDRYFSSVYNGIREQLGSRENKVMTEANDLLHQLQQNGDNQGENKIQILEQSASSVCDGLRACASTENEIMWFLVSNIKALTHYLSPHSGQPGEIRRIARSVSLASTDFLVRMQHDESIFPFVGDLYVGASEPFLLWRSSKNSFILADVKSAEAIAGNIAERINQTSDNWKSAQDRLLRLIRSLQRGGEGELSSEQLSILKDGSKTHSKSTSKKKSAKENISPAPSGQAQEPMPIRKPLAGMGFGGSGNRVPVKKRSARLLWMILLPLALLLGLAAWDISGGAPWGGSVIAPLIGVDIPSEDELDGQSPQTLLTPDEPDDQVFSSQLPQVQEEADAANGAASADALQPVDPDVAPRTLDDVNRYLNIEDRVKISEVDIHLAANRVAVLSGYRDLAYRIFEGENPDWIYPGNILRLSEGKSYVVESGDTIWFLAAREVRLSVQDELKLYDEAVVTLEDPGTNEQQRTLALENVRGIASNSPAAGMRELANNILERQ